MRIVCAGSLGLVLFGFVWLVGVHVCWIRDLYLGLCVSVRPIK